MKDTGQFSDATMYNTVGSSKGGGTLNGVNHAASFL